VTRTGIKLMLRRQLSNVVALITLIVIGVVTAVYLVDHQNAEFPSWMPIIGDNPYVVHAEMSTAQGVIPGQGQLVEVAGVIVGRVDDAHLDNGKAILDIDLERGKARIYRDASILMRPRTLLKDMILQVTPGTQQAGLLRDRDVIPVSNTLPDVNLDELLASLDTDTRDALVALAQGAGQGLRGQSGKLASVFRRFDPTMREIDKINRELMGRRREIRRVVSNFSKISATLGAHRADLTRFVAGSNQVFGALADEQAGVRATLRELPGALQDVQTTTRALTPVAHSLGSASRKLLPGARSLGAGATALDGMFGATRGVIAGQLRPLARDVREPLRELNRAVAGLSPTSEAASGSTHDLNRIFNDWAHDPPGERAASFLFWSAWSAHQINSVISGEDGLGPFAHTMTVMTCSSLGLLPGFVRSDPALALAVSLANFPTQEQVCKK
jgi:phospholipid/cholesterol/gamma-HCH transport system substrate-binding protein